MSKTNIESPELVGRIHRHRLNWMLDILASGVLTLNEPFYWDATASIVGRHLACSSD